jgi:trehalose 6-phosphate phosphatase
VTRTRPILEDVERQVLIEYAQSNVLLAFDYDGTLAPITATPDQARMRPVTQHLLTAVAQRYPTIVISGRALQDISERLRPVPVWYVFGNHGIEFGPSMPPPAQHVRTWVDTLHQELPRDLGIEIEDKTHSLALHFRRAPDRRLALEAIDRVTRQLPGVTVLGGKEVVNLLPKGWGNKGVALQFAVNAFACSHAIYVGDDETDEEAFRSTSVRDLLTIRVGHGGATHARYHVNSQEDIDRLLAALLDARQ